MRIVVLAGGIGGARSCSASGRTPGQVGAEVTAVVNVGDDVLLHGLRICPDLDSVMYTLGGGADPERGWGRVGETWTVKEELAAYGAEPTWFGLGDRDIATHLVRTRCSTPATRCPRSPRRCATRWQPGRDAAAGHRRPAGDPRRGRARTAAQRAIHFQEWWVRHRADLPTHRFVFVGAETAKPARRACSTRSAAADVVLLAPSNPVVSIAPILAVPGLRDAVAGGPAPGGRACRRSSAAPRCAAWPTTAWPRWAWSAARPGSARLYGARPAGGLLDGWLVDAADAGAAVPGVTVRAAPLWMTDEAATAAMVPRRTWLEADVTAGDPAGAGHRRRDRRATTWPR